ncbi:HAD family hydrolase [Mediterraneibacter glycyrrhizinilyticus]|uniref:HAD family hydrolase n=1 Tax=Mediterraneibacter glycyrrhizinilyticus TaxID=342942 RepID=UPI0025AACA53|nr:HAD family hydrolase [Mediterraneibacter glycyrrhizinilyticus]MDN0044877.1 HAD family hydrolase [Mediterraneibacter glycyrrhizinilyticus]
MDSIIFDVDGTIWDSTQSVADSWNKAIREHSDLDLTLDPVSLSRVFGKTMTEIADALFPALDTEARMKLLDACYAEENRYLEDHPGLLYDGVAGTIRNLSLRYPLYIVSNCQCGYIEVMLKTSGLAPYIKDHLCFGETLRPKGETIRMLMEKNSLKSPVYVGDTQGDADACKAAGIPFIFAEYGFGDVPDAATRIQRFSDLEKICL